MIDKNYSAEEVIRELKEIFPEHKTRKRSYLDQRNYLITILYYKFGYSEEMIAECFENSKHKIDRSTINHSKKQVIALTKSQDPSFQINVAMLYYKFPFDVSNAKHAHATERAVTTTYDLRTIARIVNYAHTHDKSIDQTVLHLVKTALEFIEETKIKVKWEE